MPQKNTLRIIGGNWRGRKVSFPDLAEIRPSPDRVRETLFNWLQSDIHGATCLELYSGSGILTFEALSRGAKHCVATDSNPTVTRHIDEAAAALHLNPGQLETRAIDALTFLKTTRQRFSIVFLDPPFNTSLLQDSIDQLAASDILEDEAIIYMEHHQPISSLRVPANWRLHRDKRAAAVYYGLYHAE